MTGPEASERDGHQLREELDRAILGELPRLGTDDVARAAGVSPPEARRLWRALGFPDPGEETAFTEADVEALKRIARGSGAGLDEETVVRMTRAVGSTMSRLADWEVGNLLAAFDEGNPDRRTPEDRLVAGIRLVTQITPSFEALMLYAWRRHLAAAVARAELLQLDDEAHVTTVTIGFADLVGFTALTNELDEDQIGDLVEVFEARCHDVVAGRHGRIIKSLGDSVLFVADAAAEAIDIALDIVGVIGGDQRLPDVRVGLATGPTVMRMGDVYGPSVNLAARLTAVARRNRVIIDHHTADLLPVDEFETRVLPARPIRGFGDLEPVAVRRTRPRHP